MNKEEFQARITAAQAGKNTTFSELEKKKTLRVRSVLDKKRIRQRLQRLKLWIGGVKDARAVVVIYVES